MPRYCFVVEYLGTAFAGWQIQPNAHTVEAELEKALSICLRRPIDIVGSGRTDAGVHARGQIAHFDCAEELNTQKVMRSVNALTSDNVWIRGLQSCAENFHARYDATSRYYRYFIMLTPSPIYKNITWGISYPLNLEKISAELSSVLGLHDFVNFSVDRKDGKSTECLIEKASIECENQMVIVHIQANRFLHKMVRAIVGACYDVGRGHHEAGLITAILENRFTGEWTWAPPNGLCLEKVIYPNYEY